MNKGFISLILVITVSSILLSLVFASSLEAGLFFDQAMKKQYRVMNHYYAMDCLDQAVLFLAHNYFFEVKVPLELPDHHCTLLSLQRNSDIVTVYARGNFHKAYVYRSAEMRLKPDGLEVIKIE